MIDHIAMKDMIASWQAILEKSRPKRKVVPASRWRLAAMASRLAVDEGTAFHADLLKSMSRLRDEEIQEVNTILNNKRSQIIQR